MQLPFIDLKSSHEKSRERIELAIARVLAHGQFILGPEVAEVEEKLAQIAGVQHCVTTASGTMSLEIALRALGIGPGDEVITTPFTWISTAEVIALVGAKPVFADIEPESFNLDPATAEAAITSRTKALLPVSLFGQPCKMEEFIEIAKRHNVALIEDAAQSFGSMRWGKRSGALGPIGSTSFFPAKPLGCYGDGGALFTNDPALAEKFRRLRNHGGIVRHEHLMIGTNGRFDTLQAAILLAKLPEFEAEIAARQKIGNRYSQLLHGVCQTPAILDGNTHVYAQYTIRLPERDRVAQRLKEKGIPTGVYYPKCLHQLPAFDYLGYREGEFPVAEQAAKEVLSLPMHPYLDEKTQDYIVESLIEIIRDL